MHSVELDCAKAKSAGLIDQVDPPKDNATFTVVEHANCVLNDGVRGRLRNVLTVAIVTCPFACCWL